MKERAIFEVFVSMILINTYQLFICNGKYVFQVILRVLIFYPFLSLLFPPFFFVVYFCFQCNHINVHSFIVWSSSIHVYVPCIIFFFWWLTGEKNIRIEGLFFFFRGSPPGGPDTCEKTTHREIIYRSRIQLEVFRFLLRVVFFDPNTHTHHMGDTLAQERD